MKKKLYYVYLLIVILLALILTGFLFCRKKILSPYDNIFEMQEEMDKKIEKYLDDKKYTIDNPKILLNPYYISPLTALIIFNTEESLPVDVYVNDKYMTSVDASNKHSIPIYGMYDNYNNKITLKLNNIEKIFNIKTDKYDSDEVNVEKISKEFSNNYFFISPNFVDDLIIDGNGKVIWYLNQNFGGDIEFLDNGHFYISDQNQGINGVKINYSSFLEMDYLGKIYNQWITDYGLHHEIIQLKDNKLLLLGGTDESDFVESYLYIIDKNSGKTLYYLDFYKLIYDISPKTVEKLKVKFDLVNNSASYIEDTNEVLVSLRGVNSLMKIDLDTNEIKWIYGDVNFWGKDFEKYLLKKEGNFRYLGGQHSAYYLPNGLIAVHNNDIDQFDLDNTMLEYYKNRYSEVIFYEVNEKNKTIKVKWDYTANKKYFSNVAGHIELLDNNYKLITYGWSMKDEAYENANNIMYTDAKYKNGVVTVVNNKDEEIFKVTMPSLIYRTFLVESLYDKNISNYSISKFNRINGSVVNGQKVDKYKLNKFKFKKFDMDIITNRFILNDKFDIEDEVSIIFDGQNDTYEFIYKQKNSEGPQTFNSGYSSILVNLSNDIYDVYIKVNDDIYYTKTSYDFR